MAFCGAAFEKQLFFTFVGEKHVICNFQVKRYSYLLLLATSIFIVIGTCKHQHLIGLYLYNDNGIVRHYLGEMRN